MRRTHYFSVILLCCLCAYLAYRFLFGPNVALRGRAETAYIYIPARASFAQVSDSLAPYLKHPFAFKVLARLKRYPTHIRSGRYQLEDGMCNDRLIDELRVGRQHPVRLTFGRQPSLQAFAATVSKQIQLDSQAIYRAFLDEGFLNRHALDSQTVRQILIPDTYFVYWNITASALRARLFSEYQRFWNADRRAAAQAQGLTPLQVSILASIVQSETNKREDMPMVAGVYLNRLRHHWKLQSDPTVIYALKLRHGFDTTINQLLYRDLSIDSPYNTYKHRGLPPAPIIIPTRRALEAVLHPAQHHYYYMLNDPLKPGFFLFSKTLLQHNRNKLNYKAWLRKKRSKQ